MILIVFLSIFHASIGWTAGANEQSKEALEDEKADLEPHPIANVKPM